MKCKFFFIIIIALSSCSKKTQFINEFDCEVAVFQNLERIEDVKKLFSVYYPNSWKVYINGIEAELKRVNYILRGIEIEPGNHTIEMVFDPISYNYGNLIVKISSIILLLLIIIVTIFEIRKYRNANKS